MDSPRSGDYDNGQRQWSAAPIDDFAEVVLGDKHASGGEVAASPDRVSAETLARCQGALLFLFESCMYADSLAEDLWEFAVEWRELRRLGLTCNDGRWLIRSGVVQHAFEVTSVKDCKRRFLPCANLTLSQRTCFILTEHGRQVVGQMAKSPLRVAPSRTTPWNRFPLREDGRPVKPAIPLWDRDRRELRVGIALVKQFKVPAKNQEIILAAFEEEQWPPRIDDPLPHKSNIDPQRRLHDTINSLNRNQRHRLIRFSSDGLGLGIRWKLLERHSLPR